MSLSVLRFTPGQPLSRPGNLAVGLPPLQAIPKFAAAKPKKRPKPKTMLGRFWRTIQDAVGNLFNTVAKAFSRMRKAISRFFSGGTSGSRGSSSGTYYYIPVTPDLNPDPGHTGHHPHHHSHGGDFLGGGHHHTGDDYGCGSHGGGFHGGDCGGGHGGHCC